MDRSDVGVDRPRSVPVVPGGVNEEAMFRFFTRQYIVLAIVATVLVLGMGPGVRAQVRLQEPPDEPLVRVDWVDTHLFPQVTAYVTVTEADGTTIPDLPEDAFVLFEDGQRIPPERVWVASEANQDLRLVLALDLSMPEEPFDHAREGMVSFLQTGLGAGDQVALLTFDRSVRLVEDFTGDPGEIVAALDDLEVGEPATSLNRAIVEAVDAFGADPSGRRAVMVVTHALDDGGAASVDEVIGLARDSGVPVYLVGFGSQIERPDTLRTIAESTGGQVALLTFSGDLEDSLESWGTALRSVYGVSFQSRQAVADGEPRQLTVRVSDQGRSAQVKTSYVAQAPAFSWSRETALVLGILALVAVVVVSLVVAILAARSRGQRFERRLRLEVHNTGNVRNRYELRAEDARDLLNFRFVAGRRTLPVREVVRHYQVLSTEGSPAEGGLGSGPPAGRPGVTLKGVKGMKKKGGQVKGVTGVISSVLMGVGTLLPGQMGAPLRNAAKKMKKGSSSMSRRVKIPKKKLGQVKRVQSQASKLAPKGGPGRGAAAPGGSTPGQGRFGAGAEPVEDEEPVDVEYETVQLWARTPYVEPGQALTVDLCVSPAQRPREGFQSAVKVFSRVAGADEVPTAVEERTVRIEPVGWLRLNGAILAAGLVSGFSSMACVVIIVVGLILQ